jgi:hypothetical protein
VFRILTVALAAMLALIIAVAISIPEGEVVTLITRDAAGNEFETGLWIVDIEGKSYLRSEWPDALWLDRLRAEGEVELERAGERFAVRAVPVGDPALRDAVTRAMSEKYAALDRVLGVLRDDARALPVLVERESSQYASPLSPAPGVTP